MDAHMTRNYMGRAFRLREMAPAKGILHCLFNVNVRMRKAGNVKVDKIDKTDKVG